MDANHPPSTYSLKKTCPICKIPLQNHNKTGACPAHKGAVATSKGLCVTLCGRKTKQGKTRCEKCLIKHRGKAATKYSQNPRPVLQASTAWKKRNPLKVKAYCYARIKRARDAPGSHTDEDLEQLLQKYQERCFYCGAPWEAIDHFVPLIRGGTNSPENLVPACKACNSSKQAQDPQKWMTKRQKGGKLTNPVARTRLKEMSAT